MRYRGAGGGGGRGVHGGYVNGDDTITCVSRGGGGGYHDGSDNGDVTISCFSPFRAHPPVQRLIVGTRT